MAEKRTEDRDSHFEAGRGSDLPVVAAADPADTNAPKSASSGGADEKQATLTSDAWRELRHNPLFIVAGLVVALMLVIAAFPQLFAGQQPIMGQCSLSRSLLPPQQGAIFGTDVLGCDVYGAVIWGARPSIFIGLTVTAGVGIIATLVGSLAGYFGGGIDAILSRLTDVMLGFPFLVGAIVILSAFPDRTPLIVAGVLIVFGWAGLTRIMRSSVISAKDMDYVQAARALGATNGRILFRHILPNAITPLLVLATIGVGGIIGAEAALTFLGVGLQAPTNSWGLSISQSQERFYQHPHILLFPSLFLSMTVLAFIVLGDAVRDAFDPKLR
jgi:ABC-type dipeptide/oligopeptide/nickel transport system permease subunit